MDDAKVFRVMVEALRLSHPEAAPRPDRAAQGVK